LIPVYPDASCHCLLVDTIARIEKRLLINPDAPGALVHKAFIQTGK
jgi:hypothetical protein